MDLGGTSDIDPGRMDRLVDLATPLGWPIIEAEQLCIELP